MKNFYSIHLDAFGFSTSLLCAIHCLALPLLMTFSTWSGFEMLNDHSVEITVLSLGFVFAIASIIPSYFRCHRKKHAIVLVIIGFGLIALARIVISPAWEMIVSAIGAMTIGYAHFLNWRLCRNCTASKMTMK
jgi:hypothetical protein